MQYKVGDKVVFNHKTDGFLADGVLTVSHTDTSRSTQYIRLEGYDDWFPSDRFLKVPLFKVGRIVIFKNIKDDIWYSATNMLSLEGGIGIVIEVRENYYHADKPYQDGCQYKVKDLQEGGEWLVTSASLEPLPEMANIGTIDYYLKEDIIAATTTAEAMAQAVDNVKASPFSFKVGETVVVRNDLYVDRKYDNGCRFDSNMQEYKGKITTITNVSYYKGEPRYALKIDNETFCWSPSMLLSYTPGSDYDLDKQIINQQKTIRQNENRLQEKGPVIAGRERQSGCAVRYPGEQIRVGISNLGYRKVTCKR